MENPCPNCFVLFTKNETEKNLLFWLCYGLWQANQFHPFLTGSVIPFIRLTDLKQIILHAWLKVESNPDEIAKSIEILNNLNKHQENIRTQLQLIKQAKKAIMYKVLK